MTIRRDLIFKTSYLIRNILLSGFSPDIETLSFIKSFYGINDSSAIHSLLSAGDDIDPVIDLLSYPSPAVREMIEESVPPEGFSAEEIKMIEDTTNINPAELFILFNEKKITLNADDSIYLLKQYIKRLNLELSFKYINGIMDSSDSSIICSARALLRRKKFISSDESSCFINDLIQNYRTVKNDSKKQFHDLIDFSADLLNGSVRKPLDILSEKKYYYQSAIIEAEEFTRLLKTYSMEFIMLKRMQPPHISIDVARFMIMQIDRLTSVVYGMIIPSVNNVVMDGF